MVPNFDSYDDNFRPCRCKFTALERCAHFHPVTSSPTPSLDKVYFLSCSAVYQSSNVEKIVFMVLTNIYIYIYIYTI